MDEETASAELRRQIAGRVADAEASLSVGEQDFLREVIRLHRHQRPEARALADRIINNLRTADRDLPPERVAELERFVEESLPNI